MLVIDAKKVRHLMVDRDLSSPAALAAACDPPMHYNTVYQMLRGDTFNSESADRLARALGVSTMEILTEIEDVRPRRTSANSPSKAGDGKPAAPEGGHADA
jgi:hypothetical protein